MKKTHPDPRQAGTFAKRFRGFLPVVVDVETGGTTPERDALLQIAVVFLTMDQEGFLARGETLEDHIIPFPGTNLDPEALAFNKIDPYHPFRFARSEAEALTEIFDHVQKAVKEARCQRAVLVGHNAWFDLLFVKAAAARSHLKLPFHAFTCLDTASLAGLIYGQTVLAKSAIAAGVPFDVAEAHSAIYDAEKTADLFCTIVNTWKKTASLT